MNMFAVNKIIRYNGVFAITKTPNNNNDTNIFFFGAMALRYSGVPLYKHAFFNLELREDNNKRVFRSVVTIDYYPS